MKYFFGFTDAKDPEVKPCCDVDVTGIFAANHQKAVKSGEDAAKEAKDLAITNSALSEDGTKLASAGEHIVCATLTKVDGDDAENAKTREVAFKVLAAYAKQFSGQDLDQSKVYSLQEEGDQPKAPEPEPKKEEPKDDTSDGGEISAGLNEAKKSSIDPGQFKTADDLESGGEKKKDASKDTNSDGQKQSTKLGYYFVYKLIVEGIKESAFADALKKMSTKVIDGFDMKVKFTSLFGGGGDELELSGKKMRQWFQADVDPDKLVNTFDDKVQKKFPSEKYGKLDTKIYDKNLMIKTLGGLVGAQDKKKILDADYSIAIKIPSSSKAREFIKPTLIASLMNKAIAEVQPSRKGKNKISEKDIIVVSNSKAKEIKAANSERQGSEPDENSVFAESYYCLHNNAGIDKTILFESVDSQQQIFDFFFEKDGDSRITIKFKKPTSWASPNDKDPEDFEPAIKKVVVKGTKFGDIKKDKVVETAKKKAQGAFDEYADFSGWVIEGGKNSPITDEQVFNKSTVLVAYYKKKNKADAEDDLKGAGKDFDYYVIPMPGLKYPTKDDER